EKYRTLDGMFTYSPPQAYKMIRSYGDEGRRFYMKSELTLDLLFPVTNATLACLILLKARRSTTSPIISRLAGSGVLVAYSGMVADYCENACVLTMLASYPHELYGVAQTGAVFTTTKWVLDVAAGAGAIIALVWLLRLRV